MRTAASFLGLVIALAAGYWIYRVEVAPASAEGASAVVDQADAAGVKSDLVAIGQAERLYLASHDSYATLDQLQQDGGIAFQSRHGYNFSVEVDGGQRFKVLATPAGASHAGWPVLSIDDTLQVIGP